MTELVHQISKRRLLVARFSRSLRGGLTGLAVLTLAGTAAACGSVQPALERVRAAPERTAPEREDKPARASVDCNRAKCVALTFDDGPSASGSTDDVLAALERENAKATFFMLGERAQEYPDLARKVVEEGHEIANHSWDHSSLAKQSPDQIRKSVSDSGAAIKKATGVEPILLRPPYGATNATVREIVEKLGYRQKMWDVDSRDWESKDANKVVRSVLADIDAGETVLLHDIHQSTADAVPELIKQLKKRGFTMVTVSQLKA
ncbi:polysaccharide deacetylase family protein [Microlunatus sp. GCM10028923]|uniref:polysaccharide deacetylase family protein n=1 Tax=Microlunatus sp. GCM10028923 TaxID=3273400 RepID=UPI00362076FC